MKIIVDAMGGDNAPVEIVKGCVDAVKEMDVELVLVGREAEVKAELEKCGYNGDRISVLNADEVISTEEDPLEAIRGKKNSSMVVGLNLLKNDEGDAFVSAGSTGALISGATLLVKRIKGIRRVALAPIMPSVSGCFLMVDAGANSECTAGFLKQFAIMGSVYMQSVQGIENPTVGLINIGVEESKGTQLQKDAFELMKKADYNFIGNVEVRDVPAGACDVAVADGWTGNIVLKVIEGLGKSFGKMLKAMLMKNLFTKLSALFLKDGIKGFKNKVDSSTRGGAPLLGIAKPVIKAHGNSNPVAFKNAVKQAKIFVETDVNGTISAALAKMKEEAAE